MSLAAYKVRIIANACITRYDASERGLVDILKSYNLSPDDEALVKKELSSKCAEIDLK